MEDFKWDEDRYKDALMFLASKYDDFWQQVEKFKQSKQKQSNRDWEIVSFIESGLEYKLIDWQKYQCYTQPTYEAPGRQMSLSFALRNNAKIHSVRRLSDGEVFTVGDCIEYMQWTDGGRTIKIAKFQIKGDEMYLVNAANNMSANIREADKIKRQPLFTTEDGKDIYEGDKSLNSVVFEDFSFNYNEPQYQTLVEINIFKDKIKIFSTEEAAKEYILMNKPCLSYNHVMEYCNQIINRFAPPFKEGLKELAKQKINQ